MDAKLVVIGGKANMGEVKLRLPMTIGRGSKADLIISHPTVSREHCKLTEIKGELLVTDNGSSNGTFVDGEKIEKPTIVRSGQILAIGPLTFRAEYAAKSAKAKAPKPDQSGLAETQAVDRDEFDIDFIMDDGPAAATQTAEPKKTAAQAPAKAPAGKSAESAKKPAKPEAKAPADAKSAAPAKDAGKGKGPAAPRLGETDEMDLDFLLDDVAAEKKQAPANRDTDQIDLEDLDLIAADEAPQAPSGDDLTTDFRDVQAEKVAAEKTVEFKTDEFDLGDDFFAEEKTKQPTAPPEAAAAAPEAKSPKVEKPREEVKPPAAKEAAAPKPAAQEPVAKAPSVPTPEEPKKSGSLDFDFLSAGPAAAKEEVSFGDFASQFDFSGKPKQSEAPVAPESPVEEPVAEEPVAEEPAAELPMPESLQPDEPVAATPVAENFDFDELLLEDAPAAEPSESVEAAAASDAEEKELPFSEPVAPPAASELPAMPELAAAATPVVDDEQFTLDEPTADEAATPAANKAEEPVYHEAADAAAVAPIEKIEKFDFESPLAEVPVFDAASEKMTLEDALAAEAPSTESIAAEIAKAEPTSDVEEPVADTPSPEAKSEETMDFDFLSDLDPSAVEAPPPFAAEQSAPLAAEATAGDLAEISLDLDEVPSAPQAESAAAAVDFGAMNETQDIDLRTQAEDDSLAAPTIEMQVPTADQAAPKVESADFDFLAPEAPAENEASPFDFSSLEATPSAEASDATIAFSAPVEEAPLVEPSAKEASAKESSAAPAVADDFDFLAADTSVPQAATSESETPNIEQTGEAATDSAFAGFEVDVASKDEAKTEEFDFGMFAAPATKPEPAADKPDFGIAAESDFGIGSSVDANVAPAAELPTFGLPTEAASNAMSIESAPPAPSAPIAKAKAPTAPKLSFIEKIKMLFGGGKAKPSKEKSAKSKSTQGISDAPTAKLPPLAPPKPALDPIPLDDGPAPAFDFGGPAADAPQAEQPSFDLGDSTAAWDAPPSSSAETATEAAPNAAPNAASGWKPTDAPIPLDDGPISLFEEPANPTDVALPPAIEATAAESSAEEKAPWDDIEATASVDVSESNAPFTLGDVEASQPTLKPEAAAGAEEEFDFLAGDSLLDASANPEAQASAMQPPVAPQSPTEGTESAASSEPLLSTDHPASSESMSPAVESAAAEAPAAPEIGLESPLAETSKVDDWDFDIASATESAATTEPTPSAEPPQEAEFETLGLFDDFAAPDAAPDAEPSSSSPAAADAELNLTADESAGALDATGAWTSPSLPGAADEARESMASETQPAAASAPEAPDAWSFDEFAAGPAAASPAPTTDTESPADAFGSPAAFAPSTSPPSAPSSAPSSPSRLRPVDVDLRLSSSLLSLTRLAVRPPRHDVAEMEPDLPSGRSFEPRPKSAPQAPQPAAASEPTGDALSFGDVAAADTAGPTAPNDSQPADAAGIGFSFDDWNTPQPPAAATDDAPGEPSADAAASAAAEPAAAATEGAAAEAVEEFSFLVDLPDDASAADEAPSAAVDSESPASVSPAASDASAPTDDADRTTAYLGSPKVVEEAESFLASLDESAAASTEPSFDLDTMLAATDTAAPTESMPAGEEAAASAPAADELSFLSLSDEVVASESVAEAPAPVTPDETAQAPSADADFGFLDLLDEKDEPAEAMTDFQFDAPQAGSKDSPQAEAMKIEPQKAEAGKNGNKPAPQPAAAAPANDSELDDFLRDLGMS